MRHTDPAITVGGYERTPTMTGMIGAFAEAE